MILIFFVTGDGISNTYRPKDEEHVFGDGEYARFPSKQVYFVRTNQFGLESLNSVNTEDLPKDAVIVDMIEFKSSKKSRFDLISLPFENRKSFNSIVIDGEDGEYALPVGKKFADCGYLKLPNGKYYKYFAKWKFRPVFIDAEESEIPADEDVLIMEEFKCN